MLNKQIFTIYSHFLTDLHKTTEKKFFIRKYLSPGSKVYAIKQF